MSHSQTPRILHFTNISSQTAVERLLRAKWQDGRPVLDFTHVKTLVLEFDMFQDVHWQLTRELFETVSYLEELQIIGMSYSFSTQNYGEILVGLSEMISLYTPNLRTLQVETELPVLYDLCHELKALAGNKAFSKVLQVLKFTFHIEGCEHLVKEFRELEEVLMDPGWSALVCVSIDIVVSCSHEDRTVKLVELLESVPKTYLGRLSSRKILSYHIEYCIILYL